MGLCVFVSLWGNETASSVQIFSFYVDKGKEGREHYICRFTVSAGSGLGLMIIRQVNQNKRIKISYSKIPVVPAGVIYLKCCTKSSLSLRAAVLKRQRTHRLVSSSGCCRDASPIRRLLLNSSTTSSLSIVWTLLRTLSGRERTDSSWPNMCDSCGNRRGY